MLYLLEKLMRAVAEDGYVVFRRHEIERIHGAALTILEEMGCRVDHARMRELLESLGAKVNRADNVVRFPRRVVEAAIEKRRLPDASGVMRLEKMIDTYRSQAKDRSQVALVSAVAGGFAPRIYDLDQQKARPATKADLEQACIVADSLQNPDGVGPLFLPHDVPSSVNSAHVAEVLLKRARRPTGFQILSRQAVRPIKELFIIAAGDFETAKRRYKPSHEAYVSSPFFFTVDELELGFALLGEGFPVFWGSPMPIAGATAPVTLAGALAQTAAESLVGLMCAVATEQEWYPGMAPAVMDQRTGMTQYSGPDRTILALACADLLHFWGQPRRAHIGHTDACAPGCQAGIEKTYGMLIEVMAFGSGHTHAGALGPGGGIGSIEQILIDSECAAALTRLFRGEGATEEEIALDVIREMGIAGSVLGMEHTAKHFREALWLPRLFQRVGCDAFSETHRDMVVAAAEWKRKILAEHDPHPLSPDQEREMVRVLKAADAAARV